MLGVALVVELANLPLGTAVVAMGFSDTQSGPFPLPLALGPFGMPGCSLLADPLAAVLVASPGTRASWVLPIPNVPALVGAAFYNQAFALDPSANAAGLTATNGGRATIGL